MSKNNYYIVNRTPTGVDVEQLDVDNLKDALNVFAEKFNLTDPSSKMKMEYDEGNLNTRVYTFLNIENYKLYEYKGGTYEY